MALAIPFGFFTKTQGSEAVGWIGDVFLRLLKMVVVPLILFSIIAGVSGVGNIKGVGRLGIKTVGYYLVTTTLAIFVGLILSNLIHPGQESLRQITEVHSSESLQSTTTVISQEPSAKQLLFRLIPENPVEDMVYSSDDPKQGPNILGVIFFAVLFGACVLVLPESKRKRLREAKKGRGKGRKKGRGRDRK